ncbi:hypothetical protein SLG_23130 [Sphingobium sp. SYK-6]|uniref:hypothetical protein n=1 Tax=Sphingobium sp. (strain NBRC 103272 / SYK-6) TaxID=627192 RepID=UPI00022772BF|nr:hypothetical protein [Sphingobium sp. SYK-6]BAK66988.1 hypothetical protein SLG_23130 [Sphingobium sp. SYK-6]
MRGIGLLISVALVVGGASSALAQGPAERETGTIVSRGSAARHSDRPGLSKEAQGRILAYRFANCVVDRRSSDAKAYIDAQYGSPEAFAILNRLVKSRDECLYSGKLRTPTSLLRGAIFRSAYVRDFGRGQLAMAEAAPNHAEIMGGTPNELAIQHAMLLDFGSCLTRAEPEAARRFVLAEPASGMEDEALSKLAPKMGACLQQGSTAKFNRSSVNAILAEAIYREAQAGQASLAALSGKQ